MSNEVSQFFGTAAINVSRFSALKILPMADGTAKVSFVAKASLSTGANSAPYFIVQNATAL